MHSAQQQRLLAQRNEEEASNPDFPSKGTLRELRLNSFMHHLTEDEIHVVEWTRHNTPFLMELNFRNTDTLELVDFEEV